MNVFSGNNFVTFFDGNLGEIRSVMIISSELIIAIGNYCTGCQRPGCNYCFYNDFIDGNSL